MRIKPVPEHGHALSGLRGCLFTLCFEVTDACIHLTESDSYLYVEHICRDRLQCQTNFGERQKDSV